MHSVTLPAFPVTNVAPVRPEAMSRGLSPLGTTGHNHSAGSAARAQPARQGEVLPSESETVYWLVSRGPERPSRRSQVLTQTNVQERTA